jgi:hypothetical protein
MKQRRRVPSSVLSSACYLLRTGFLLGVFFDSEDEDYISLRNVCRFPADYTASISKDEALRNHRCENSNNTDKEGNNIRKTFEFDVFALRVTVAFMLN